MTLIQVPFTLFPILTHSILLFFLTCINVLMKFLTSLPDTYTQRNNSENLEYDRLLSSHEDLTPVLYDFTCILLSKTAQDVESTLQDVETKCNSVNITAISYWRFFNRNPHLK